MVDAFSAPDTIENRAVFIVAVWRNQNRDRLAKHFVSCIPEQPLCAVVPTCNIAIEVPADDCVITRLDDGAEPAKTLLAFAQRCFDLDPFDEFCGQSDVHIQRSNLLFCWVMRLDPMG